MGGAKRLLWLAIVAVYVALAVAAPATIISRHVGSSSAATTRPTPGTRTTVHMAGLKFSPGKLIVVKGTTVVFDNDDVAPHTVTAQSGGGVDSGVLSPGKSFTLVVSSGLAYFC